MDSPDTRDGLFGIVHRTQQVAAVSLSTNQDKHRVYLWSQNPLQNTSISHLGRVSEHLDARQENCCQAQQKIHDWQCIKFIIQDSPRYARSH